MKNKIKVVCKDCGYTVEGYEDIIIKYLMSRGWLLGDDYYICPKCKEKY
jgi:hypothetical protein